MSFFEGRPEAGLLLAGAEVQTQGRVDVRLCRGVISEIGEGLRPEVGELAIQCGGGALLPGLHDHHCHVLAASVTSESVMCGPPAVRDAVALAARLGAAVPREGWVRGVGYDEAVAGEMDASVLDRLAPHLPTR